jgi:hypothetical protein
MANINHEIEKRIQRFVRDLHAEIAATVRGAIASSQKRGGGRAAPLRSSTTARAAKPAKRSAGKRGPGTGQKRTSAEVDALAARLLQEIKKGQGRRIEQIADAMRIRTETLKLPVIKLMEGKKIRTTGTRRGTKYFVK